MVLRRKLKKSQRHKLRGKKPTQHPNNKTNKHKEVVDLRWVPRVDAEELMKPVTMPQTLGRPGEESCF